MNSDMYVSDYCCTTGSIICKPKTCSNLLNTNEIITQDASRCTASTAIVSCCMRKLVCCTSTPYYCDSIPPRRYICRDCGTSFRQNVHLRKHIMIQHTKMKPFSCPYCEYTTVEKSHLTVHIRTHTGERPFSCRECNYSSAQNCTLKSHYLRKHPTNLIKCNFCSELFFTELELTKHLRGCSLSFLQQ
ncbi:putative zinc finger protein [Schistosoma mansoni]|uniref:putative zinc finger protein n=1 Tax=Schistosoma mansoni TaxID=6183 RepID=UPI0001A643D5|nr:putative zinc finger protein [Schistosoma mansoni]|eukprot:XP_018653188.1 putative zinc finger protein [Schistosoma mansoni]